MLAPRVGHTTLVQYLGDTRGELGGNGSGPLALAWPVSSLGDPELEQWVHECAAEWSAVFSQQRCLALKCLDGSLVD